MLRFIAALSIVLLLQPTGARADAEPAKTTAFVHVNVVPMDRERVLRDQTVLVRGDRIVAIGRKVEVPTDVARIDGHGTAWLSPGLADMHTHSQTKNDLAVYLANGVTTVLNMGDARAGFVDKIVPAVNHGEVPGPHVYTSFLVDGSPDYNGFVVRTPEEARAFVHLAKTNGYDFIKVYVDLSPEVFSAFAEEGARLGLPLIGHGVRAVRLARQLEQGQALVAHAEEFFYTFFTPPGVEETDTPPDLNRIPEAVALVKRHAATVTADLGTYAAIAHQIGHAEVIAQFLARPDSYFLAPSDRLRWQMSDYVGKSARLEPKLEFLRHLVKAMADAGVELVAGTDAPAVPGCLPGFSLHDDLAELEASGLTRYQVLTTATRAPGAFIERTKHGDRFGLVAPGYRADLVLSSQNPLASLATLRRPLGVMAAGQWRDAAALDALKDHVRESYRQASAGY
ncbi:amidohydrolase family protein [Rudaea sp.]|uniref:amidohydrolase family protein n=1 Tax=Rudaea sp. TaxID=2136325 RepID=UPI002ED6610B